MSMTWTERTAMAATGKTHSPEFKAKLVVEALKEQRIVQEIAAEHDLNPN